MANPLDTVFKITADASGADRTIAQIQAELKLATAAAKNAVLGSDEYFKSIKRVGSLRTELKEVSKELKGVGTDTRNSLGGINENVKLTERSYGELLQIQKQLRREVDNLTTDQLQQGNALVDRYREVNEALFQYNQTLKGTASFQNQVAAAIRQTQGDGGKLGGVVTNIGQQFNNFGATLKDNILGVGAAFTGVGLANKLVELGQAGVEAVQRVAEARKEIQALTRATGAELSRQTGLVLGVADTFGQEVSAVTKATQALTRELGGSFEDNVKLIELGFAAGANAGGDFLDVIREYSAQIRAAGLSSEQFLAIQIATQREGIYSDKGIDAIKEAGLRLREQSKATTEAVQALFGFERGNQLLADLEKGSITSFEAVQQISLGLRDVGANSKVAQQVIADVFGGAGEDAGRRFLELLGDINTDIRQIEASLTDAQKAQLELARSQQELQTALADLAAEFTGSGSKIRLFFNDVLEGAVEIITALVRLLRGSPEALTALGRGFEAFGRAIVNNVLAPVKSAGAAISELFSGNFSNAAKLAGQAVFEFSQAIGTGLITAVADGAKAFNDYLEATDPTLIAEREEAARKSLESARQGAKAAQADAAKLQDERVKRFDDEVRRRIELVQREAEEARIVALERQAAGELNEKEYQATLLRIAADAERQKLEVFTQAQAQADALQIKSVELEKQLADQSLAVRKLTAEQQVGVLKEQLAREEQARKDARDFTLEEEKRRADAQKQLEADLAAVQSGEFKSLTVAQQGELLKRLEQNSAYLENVAELQGDEIGKFVQTEQTKRDVVEATGEIRRNTEFATAKAVIVATRQVFDNFTTLLGEQSAAGQAFATFSKTLTLFQIGLDTAEAISSLTLESNKNPLNGFTGGAAGFIQFATGIARILANISQASQIVSGLGEPKAPKFAAGGILQGPSHSAGGIQTPYGELEGGEAVINKRSTAMFTPILSAINQAGGGAALAKAPTITVPRFATGGLLPSAPVFDISSQEERIQQTLQTVLQGLPAPQVAVRDINIAQEQRAAVVQRNSF